jgi:ankyrin repeat protein
MYKNFIVILLLCLTTNAVAMMKINHKKYSVRIRAPKTKYITLHDAAQMGDREKIEKILPYYDNIDIINTNGESPLFVAIKYNNKEAAEIFLNNGANPNILNKQGATPLTHAIKNRSLECTMLLLAKNARPTIGEPRPECYLVNFYGESPSDEKVIENYKFLVPVHSAFLHRRLAPLYLQQQYKLTLFAKFILQHYLSQQDSGFVSLSEYLKKRKNQQDIIDQIIRKLLEVSNA